MSSSEAASPEALVSALADPARLRLFGRICAAPDGLAAAGDARTAKLARRLVSAGLVSLAEDRYRAVPEAFRDALAKPPADPVEGLFSRGRLVAIPRPGRLRQAVFARLAGEFTPGRRYTERNVRDKLAPIHDDHAALRRHLVDEGLLRRSDDGSAYWRA
ncbi:DUF2087 domain-containing protein [Amycolatopsis saalfeldensis]|nr:DUF2087 domain-containing protein [Amycolatopsis saalfeldensis]